MSKESSNNTRSEPLVMPEIEGYLARKTFPEIELPKIFNTLDPLVIFDIGACEGEDSIRYARLFPNSQVYTFEPLPENREIIDSNFQKYGCENSTLYDLALSNQNGVVDFHVSGGRPEKLWEGENWNYGNKSSSILAPAAEGPVYGWLEFKQKVEVLTQTLDTFCQEAKIDRIDFIHMDVQGAELLVLNGAKKMLKNTRSIWLEVSEVETYKGQCLRTDVESFMEKAGFLLVHFESRGEEGDQFYVNKSLIPFGYIVTWWVRKFVRTAKNKLKR
jgi:FkbM family methyltransferase